MYCEWRIFSAANISDLCDACTFRHLHDTRTVRQVPNDALRHSDGGRNAVPIELLDSRIRQRTIRWALAAAVKITLLSDFID
jgi:hypothetical protein